MACRRGDPERAALLLGASEAIRRVTGYEFEPAEQRLQRRVHEELGPALDDPATRAALTRGSSLDVSSAREIAQRE